MSSPGSEGERPVSLSWGPFTRFGLIVAATAAVIDQACKLWLLYVFDIGHRGTVRVTPFFDLVLAWNIGISFGWLQNDSQAAQLSLMAIKAIAVVLLAIWMVRSQTVLATVAASDGLVSTK